jgi:hypothetical protein
LDSTPAPIIHRNDGKVEFWVEAKGRRIVDSIEQGLLMAIMKEKFNKEWNSENKEWVKNA